mmetsp:Transcript_40678/g.97557  ORF Transcript_40678/g.97557 Transcript_40678/m.97557 type:complete len:798 (+) Transcript_40678:72-2465(+)
MNSSKLNVGNKLSTKPSSQVSKNVGAQSSRTRGTTSTAEHGVEKVKVILKIKGQPIDVTPHSLLPSEPPPKVDVAGDGQRAESASPEIGEGVDEAYQKAVDAAKGYVGLSHAELDRVIDITLSESETCEVFHVPSLCVPLDNTVVHNAIMGRNKQYEDLVQSKSESDNFRGQHAQTLNNPQKVKAVHHPPAATENREVNASQWDIYDTFAEDEVPRWEEIEKACEKESTVVADQCLKKPGCLLNVHDMAVPAAAKPKQKSTKDSKLNKSGKSALAAGTTSDSIKGDRPGKPSPAPAAAEAPEAEHVESEKRHMAWLVGAETVVPSELHDALRVMERIVSQNVFHTQHMIYRNYPTLEELAALEAKFMDDAGPDKGEGAGVVEGDEDVLPEEAEEGAEQDNVDEEPDLQDLFCFENEELTAGLAVTCAEWNRVNQDLLAVSYGDTSAVPTNKEGLVLFWSLKNPTYPERVLRMPSGVTSIHFSSVHPNLISAGMHDGNMGIWDLRKDTDQPVLESGHSKSDHNDRKHTDVVWETRWVDRGAEKVPREFNVTVSSDGRVLRWNMKKGLEQQTLMQLKRLPNPNLASNSVYGHKDGIVFRQACGLCVDFPRHDSVTYIVGSEDGLVHRCSTSYNEQYLETYYGHAGPVYKVRCNPFYSKFFLSCSADWTIKLWSMTQVDPTKGCDTPLQNFQSTDLCDAVNDVTWSPHNSTSFAACMDDGRVELWDLSKKPLDPIVVHYPGDPDVRRKRTVVRFSENSPVLICGDDRGSVNVMRMHNTDIEMMSENEQQERLYDIMTKKR